MVKRSDLREVIGLAIIPTILGVGVPVTALFAFGGAESQANLSKFVLYGVMLYSSVLSIMMVRLLKSEGFFARNPDLEPLSRMTAHSPSNTWLYKTLKDQGGVFEGIADVIKSPVAFTLLWIPLALIFGTAVAFTGTFISGIPTLVEGQISETAQVALAGDPAVIAETMFIFVFMFWIVYFLTVYFLKEKVGFKGSKRNEFLAGVLGKLMAVLIIPTFNLGYHIFRYGASEKALANIWMQGFTYSSTMAVFDSMISAYLIHWAGNVFLKMSSVFTSEATLLFTAVVTILALPVLVWLTNPLNFLGK